MRDAKSDLRIFEVHRFGEARAEDVVEPHRGHQRESVEIGQQGVAQKRQDVLLALDVALRDGDFGPVLVGHGDGLSQGRQLCVVRLGECIGGLDAGRRQGFLQISLNMLFSCSSAF